MIPVTYSYQCSCGYHYTQQENAQHDAYLRLLISVVLLCPECKGRLMPAIAVAYAPLQQQHALAAKSQQLISLLAQWQQGDVQEQRETFQALVDAGVIDKEQEPQ